MRKKVEEYNSAQEGGFKIIEICENKFFQQCLDLIMLP